MKISIDFSKHKSLGNAYDETKPDNAKFFVKAEELYTKCKTQMEDSIKETVELQTFQNGGTISIPTSHFHGSGFIKSMVFNVEEINEENCKLSLKKIMY